MAYGSAIYKSKSATVAGTSSLSVSYPSGIVAGDLIVLCTVWKPSVGDPTMNTPSGFNLQDAGYTQFSAGAGNPGDVDGGPAYCSIFYRIADGTESGSVSLGWSGAITSCQSTMLLYSKPLDCEWGSMLGLAGYDVSANNTSWITINYDGGQYLKPNETIVSVVGINTDAYTYSSRTFSQTGLSITSTDRESGVGTSNGTDQYIIVRDHKVTSGTSSTTAWSLTMTSSGYTTAAPTGPVLLMVIRVVPLKPLKRWAGSVWRRSPLRSWNGSNWQYSAANYSRPLKRWDGSAWRQVSSLFLYPDPSTYNITADAQVVYPTIFNGHETDISISDGWISLIYSTDIKVHKNEFALGLNILGNGGSARTGYVYFSVDGVTYKTLTINQEEAVGPTTLYWDYGMLDFDYNGNECLQNFNYLFTDAQDWVISYEDTGYGTDWAGVYPLSGSGNNAISITVDDNGGSLRTMGVLAQSSAYPSYYDSFIIRQYAVYDGCL
jgi:hypothetical protein